MTDRNAKARDNAASSDCALVKDNSTQERRLVKAVRLTLTARNRTRIGRNKIPGIHVIALPGIAVGGAGCACAWRGSCKLGLVIILKNYQDCVLVFEAKCHSPVPGDFDGTMTVELAVVRVKTP